MKKFLLLLLTIGSLYWTFGQVCGTPHPTNPIIYSNNERARVSSSAFCIDVFFHIVRHTNGTNAFALPNTDEIVRRLNEFYIPHNIIINNAGTTFLNNSGFVNIDDENEASTLGQTHNRSDAINYYIVETLWPLPRNFILYGIANGIPSNNLVIRRDRVLTPDSPHELGHCLGLYHTHENSLGIEAINGSNCSTAGDLVCDTPADPGYGIDFSCVYTGVSGYNPLTDNIMSHSRDFCRRNFTNGQGQRMRTALSVEVTLNGITSNCVRISRVNNLCYSQTTVVSLSNLGGATTTIWTSSNNVQIVSRSNSDAVIRASSIYGTGWVRATLSNGIEFTERFKVGTLSVGGHYLQRIHGQSGQINLTGRTWNRLRIRNTNGVSVSGFQWEVTATNSYIRHSERRGDFMIFPRQSSGNIIIKFRARNACGYSSWAVYSYRLGSYTGIPDGDQQGPVIAPFIFEGQ